MGSVPENAHRSCDAEQNATEPLPRHQSGSQQAAGAVRGISENLVRGRLDPKVAADLAASRT